MLEIVAPPRRFSNTNHVLVPLVTGSLPQNWECKGIHCATALASSVSDFPA